MDQYAADVRRRLAAKPSTVRAENRRTARRAASEIRADLPGVSDEQLGAVRDCLAEILNAYDGMRDSMPPLTVVEFPAEVSGEEIARYKAIWAATAGGPVKYRQAGREDDV